MSLTALFQANNVSKTSTLLPSNPNNVVTYTEVGRPASYRVDYNNSQVFHTEGVIVWQDAAVLPAGRQGVTLTLNLINHVLKKESMNKVAGLCQRTIPGPAGVWQYHPVAGVDVRRYPNVLQINLPINFKATLPTSYPAEKAAEFPSFRWTEDKAITFEDVKARFTPVGIFNEVLTGFPVVGGTTGIRLEGPSRLVDVWEPVLSKQSIPMEYLPIGTPLQFTIVVESEKSETGQVNVFYEIVPTVNGRGVTPPQFLTAVAGPAARLATTVTGPTLLWEVGEVTQTKKLKQSHIDFKHRFGKATNGVPVFTDFKQDSLLSANLHFGRPY